MSSFLHIIQNRLLVILGLALDNCGTLIRITFLGEGYSLTLTYGGECDVEKTTVLVKDCIPTSSIKSNASGELIFSLPAAESTSFGTLFESLEKRKTESCCSCFALQLAKSFIVHRKHVEIRTRD